MLPWGQISDSGITENTGPHGGGALFLGVLGVIVAYFGLSTFAGKPSIKSCIAMSIGAAAMVFLTLIAYPSMHQQAQGLSFSPGLGLFLYGAGTTAISVGVVRAWRSLRADRVSA